MTRLKRALAALTAAIVCTMGTPAVLPELADTVVMSASAAEELTYGDLTYEVYDGVIFITGCDKSAEVVKIPAKIDGKAVTEIGDWAFSYCTNLTNITIPESVTNIGIAAFTHCTSLTSITIPESVMTIGDGAFRGCTRLTIITIPASVTEIGDWAFAECTSLTGIEAESDNEYYVSEDGVLFNKDKTELICCPGGKEEAYVIPDSVAFIHNGAFSGCTNLTGIEAEIDNEYYASEDGVLFNKDKTELICCPGGKEGAYVIPDSVTFIYDVAFFGCTSLTSLTIPANVTEISAGAFSGCINLTGIEAESNNEYYVSEDGVLFNKDKTGLICCPGGKEGAYVIPDSVTGIENYAFIDCASLTSITIPESVTWIDRSAFHDCTSLTSITIPKSVTYISPDAFYGCESLTDVYYTGTEEQWNAIKINFDYEPFTGAAIHFNSGAPVKSGLLLAMLAVLSPCLCIFSKL